MSNNRFNGPRPPRPPPRPGSGGVAPSSWTNERSRLLEAVSSSSSSNINPTASTNNPEANNNYNPWLTPTRSWSFLGQRRYASRTSCSVSCVSAIGAIVLSLFIFCGVVYVINSEDVENGILAALTGHSRHYPFATTHADNFTWGVATSSYQIEGAINEDGRSPSIWDVFCKQPGATLDGKDGHRACDHYHRVEQDVALMAEQLSVKAYRFSIAWPRIIHYEILATDETEGPPRYRAAVNRAGLAFYNHLIDTLLRYEIEPWVTLFHWDLPQALQEDYGGWLGYNTSEAFATYAQICFEAFGDRVRYWITLNEPWTVAVNGHATGIHAPGHRSTTEPYLVGHNLLLGHGLAVQAFREYQNRTNTTHQSWIGIANCGDYRYPTTVADNSTAERVMLFQMGWFTDPLFFGDYPAEMRKRLGPRLPEFSVQESALLKGSVDFVGLNYYSALQASTPTAPPTLQGYWTSDIDANLHPHPDWRLNDMGWAVVPDGLRNMLVWIARRYNNPLIYVTENGDAERRDGVNPLADVSRQTYLMQHVRAVGQAMEAGVRLGGYFAWTLMDNFEWQFGYTKKFGLFKVDFADGSLRRTPKGSAHWYNKTIVSQGRNIARAPPLSWFPTV